MSRTHSPRSPASLLPGGMSAGVLILTGVLVLVQQGRITELEAQSVGLILRANEQKAKAQLDRLLDPVGGHLAVIGRWLEEEMPKLADAEAFNSRLIPILQETPQVDAAVVAAGGTEYMLRRIRSGWVTRHLDADRGQGRAEWRRWSGPATQVESWDDKLDYDPRRRPWYQGALEADGGTVFWTPPYKFFTTGELGITASRYWGDPTTPDGFRVCGLDVRLQDISALTMSLRPKERGVAFMIAGDGNVVGLPYDPQFTNQATMAAAVLTPAETFAVPALRLAYTTWAERGRVADDPVTFRHGDERWWAMFGDYPVGEATLWFGVAVPDDALPALAGMARVSPLVWMGLPGLALSLVLFFGLRRVSPAVIVGPGAHQMLPGGKVPMDELSDRLAEIIAAGESDQLEFKASVRWNFKAGRTGKEMEMAWLKTVAAFLNSEGGMILLGVGDDGTVLGLENDGFANDDKALRHVDNLIAQHIGAAHARFIRLRMITLDAGQVIAVVCFPAPEPAFLKSGKTEEFYIRTGPATRSLPYSEAIAQIEARRSTKP